MLQRLFIFLLLFLVLPDLYLYFRFIVRLTAKWWLRGSLLGTQFLANRRASLLGLLLPTTPLRNAIHRTIGWFSIIFLPVYGS